MLSKPKLILTYHSLDNTGSVISIHPLVFRSHMAHLARSGTPVVPLEELPGVPEGVALTFDDAFLNFHKHAIPVLTEFGLPATVFVVSDYCGRRNNWPSQPGTGIPLMDLMNWNQLREIQKCGITLGAHTLTHPRLSSISSDEVHKELLCCREEIEQRTGTAVRTFSYPYGDSTAKVRRCAAQHFRIACGTALSELYPGCDLYDLPRVDAFYVRTQFWFNSLLTARGTAYLAFRRTLRNLRQRVSR